MLKDKAWAGISFMFSWGGADNLTIGREFLMTKNRSPSANASETRPARNQKQNVYFLWTEPLHHRYERDLYVDIILHINPELPCPGSGSSCGKNQLLQQKN
jgi:hypothetical protein